MPRFFFIWSKFKHHICFVIFFVVIFVPRYNDRAFLQAWTMNVYITIIVLSNKWYLVSIYRNMLSIDIVAVNTTLRKTTFVNLVRFLSWYTTFSIHLSNVRCTLFCCVGYIPVPIDLWPHTSGFNCTNHTYIIRSKLINTQMQESRL